MVACQMNTNSNYHQPVLLSEGLQALAIQSDGIYVDATFGRGGHASAILQQLGPFGKLFAMDKDLEAIRFANQQFASDPRFKIQQGSFAKLAEFLTAEGVLGQVNGILFDLGVSSPQLDNPARGFSFLHDGALDMRMDSSQGLSAAELIATLSETQLATLLWEYGEERYSRRIARAIVIARKEAPITTTTHLANIIAKAHPAWQKGKNPATRSFQAIRIAVNQELVDLSAALSQSLKALKVHGRLVVISFHSLEDRLVKQFMQHQERCDPFPAKLPIKETSISSHFKRLGPAIKPNMQEIASNPRSRSAVLRTGEKLS